MNNIKKLISLTTVAIMLFSFAACNREGDSQTETVTEVVTSVVEKTVEVTNATGETVTEKSGEAVTETVTEVVTKVIKKEVPATTSKKEKTEKTKETTKNNETETTSATTNTTTKATTTTTTKAATTTTTKASDGNDKLRKEIESTYGVTVYYGNEYSSYTPGSGKYKITRLTDYDMITESLNGLKTALAAYPTGFFKDFKNFNMPLTFLLVESAKTNSGADAWSGFADSEFKDRIVVSLVYSYYGLTHTAHHEIMHCIDNYLELKMYPKTPYDDTKALNPSGFEYQYDDYVDYTWPTAYEKYCYPNTSSNGEKIYFVSTYSLTGVREDRAETFKYMMRTTYIPAGVMSSTSVTTKKADVISNQIKKYFPSASSGLSTWNKLHP